MSDFGYLSKIRSSQTRDLNDLGKILTKSEQLSTLVAKSEFLKVSKGRIFVRENNRATRK